MINSTNFFLLSFEFSRKRSVSLAACNRACNTSDRASAYSQKSRETNTLLPRRLHLQSYAGGIRSSAFVFRVRFQTFSKRRYFRRERIIDINNATTAVILRSESLITVTITIPSASSSSLLQLPPLILAISLTRNKLVDQCLVFSLPLPPPASRLPSRPQICRERYPLHATFRPRRRRRESRENFRLYFSPDWMRYSPLSHPRSCCCCCYYYCCCCYSIVLVHSRGQSVTPRRSRLLQSTAACSSIAPQLTALDNKNCIGDGGGV